MIRDVLGAAAVEVEVAPPETVKGVFDALLREHGRPLAEKICDPNTGELTPFPIRLNDEIISSILDGDRPIESGDEVTIISPVGGGC